MDTGLNLAFKSGEGKACWWGQQGGIGEGRHGSGDQGTGSALQQAQKRTYVTPFVHPPFPE